MTRILGALLAAALLPVFEGSSRADDTDPKAVLDKAIKAAGGEDKLSAIKAATWKSKGKITLGGNDNPISIQATVKGLDHYRSEFEGEFNGNTVQGVTVLAGDKGWRKFGDNAMEMDADAVANEKRNLIIQLGPVFLLPLKGKDFKLASAGEEKVGDKPAVGVKVTCPDGKDFTLYFDKESGLPAKLKATVKGFQGEDFDQETTFADYKEMGGIKKATKVESKRNGEPFLTAEISDFKALDKTDADTFTEPK